MRNLVVVPSLCLALLLIGGCETAPAPKPTTTAAVKPKPAAPTPAPAPKIVAAPPEPVAPVAPAPLPLPAAPIVRPKLSPEAAALVERLTNGNDEETLPHEVSDTTGFPGAIKSLQPGAPAPRVESSFDNSPQPPPSGLTADGNSTYLVERDWTGLVLIPISKSLSKAHTSDVKLAKVEAHPLTDGRVRIWTRIQNTGNQQLPAQVACEFRLRGVHLTSPYFYDLSVPANGYRDVFFVSPEGELNSYTVLVRSADAVQQ